MNGDGLSALIAKFHAMFPRRQLETGFAFGAIKGVSVHVELPMVRAFDNQRRNGGSPGRFRGTRENKAAAHQEQQSAQPTSLPDPGGAHGLSSPLAIHSPKRSPSIKVGKFVFELGTVGKRLASATTRFSVPKTLPQASVAAP